MKILVISSNFPPYHLGGYEIRIKNILDELSDRGHQIRVLSTLEGKKERKISLQKKYIVLRNLHNRLKARFFPKEIFFDILDISFLAKQITQFNPDVIYLGHTYVLSKALLPLLATSKIPIVYDEGGAGIIEAWTEHGRWFRFTGDYRSQFAILNKVKPVVIEAVCKISQGRIHKNWAWPETMHIIFNSELNYRNSITRGVLIEDAKVIHAGIDTGKFSFKTRTRLNNPLKIIVPGRIERRKGQMDAVQLLKCLLVAGIDTRIILVGFKYHDSYFDEIIDEIQNFNLNEYCTILPMLSQDALVNLYHDSDICFFTSYHRTGFSRTPLEAMACGCSVISYGNEGSDEIFRDYMNCFIVGPQNFSAIVEIIKGMIVNPEMVEKKAFATRREIEENYTMIKYINFIEDLILSTKKHTYMQ